jgi:hypothetical protein
MKYGFLALILLVCASMSLVAQIQSPSTVRANGERTSAIDVLKGDIETGATTLTALILNRFAWAKELLRELLLHYGIALKDRSATSSANTNVISLQRFPNILMPPCWHEIRILGLTVGGCDVGGRRAALDGVRRSPRARPHVGPRGDGNRPRADADRSRRHRRGGDGGERP